MEEELNGNRTSFLIELHDLENGKYNLMNKHLFFTKKDKDNVSVEIDPKSALEIVHTFFDSWNLLDKEVEELLAEAETRIEESR